MRFRGAQSHGSFVFWLFLLHGLVSLHGFSFIFLFFFDLVHHCLYVIMARSHVSRFFFLSECVTVVGLGGTRSVTPGYFSRLLSAQLAYLLLQVLLFGGLGHSYSAGGFLGGALWIFQCSTMPSFTFWGVFAVPAAQPLSCFVSGAPVVSALGNIIHFCGY